jgi:hypothetical protein
MKCEGSKNVSTIRGTSYKKVAGLSDDNLMFISDMIDRFMKPDHVEEDTSLKRIGIKKGTKMYADDYDFDEMNDQIADMFGGD